MGLISDFGTAVGKAINVQGIADELFAKVWPWIQQKVNEQTPQVEAWAEAKAGEIADKYTPIIIEKLLAMMPTLAATVAKVAVEEAFKQIPNLPNVVLPPVEQITTGVVQTLANDVQNIPGLSEIVNLPSLFGSWLPHTATGHTAYQAKGGS